MFTGGLIAAAAVLALSGCQQQTQKSPDEVIKQGLTNLTNVKSYQFDASANGDITASQAVDPTSTQAATPIKTTFNVALGGSVDFKDMNTPKMIFKLDGSGNSGDQKSSGAAELRMNADALYFIVSKLDSKNDQMIPKDFADQYIGKWWKYKVPADLMEQFKASLPEGGTQEKLTPEQQKMKDLFDNTKFFKNVQFVAIEDVKGEQSYHYTVEFDEDAFMDYAQKVAQEQGKPMTAEEKQQMQDAMKKLDISGGVWVGTASNILNQVSGNIKIQAASPEDPSGTISLKGTTWDFDKPVVVEAPAGALDLPLDQIFQGFAGAGLSDGAMTGGSEQLNYDPSSLDGYGTVSGGVNQ